MKASGLRFDFILCEIILYIFFPSILFTTPGGFFRKEVFLLCFYLKQWQSGSKGWEIECL